MNSLDSRFLRVGDCFAQPFPTPGEIRYLLSSGSALPNPPTGAREGYVIEVQAKTGSAKTAQHVINVKATKSGPVPDPDKLTIQVGDVVLWYTADPAVGGFSVSGAGEKFSFSSQTLRAEAIYTHAFGVAGIHEWADPVLGKVSGSVEVLSPKVGDERETQAWLKQLESGVSFEIKGGIAKPSKVQVVVGQTVFWKVWDGSGMAVTDKRLVPKG